MEEKIDTDKMGKPSFSMVLTGLGGYAYPRPDGICQGAIFENVISQMLRASGNPLNFFARNNSSEIDFLLSKNGKLIPFEALPNSKSKSLSTLLQEYPEAEGMKLINGNAGMANRILTWLLYRAMFL